LNEPSALKRFAKRGNDVAVKHGIRGGIGAVAMAAAISDIACAYQA